MHGEAAEWGLPEQFLASILDALHGGNWQRGGGKGTKPKPVQRPGDKTRIGKTVLSLDDMDAFLGYSPRA